MVLSWFHIEITIYFVNFKTQIKVNRIWLFLNWNSVFYQNNDLKKNFLLK